MERCPARVVGLIMPHNNVVVDWHLFSVVPCPPPERGSAETYFRPVFGGAKLNSCAREGASDEQGERGRLLTMQTEEEETYRRGSMRKVSLPHHLRADLHRSRERRKEKFSILKLSLFN